MTELDDDILPLRPIGAEIADRLEAAIIREVFAPGEKLGEEALCARFGVSRSPLRDAFPILESRGLVERRPRLGTRVTEMSVERLDELTVCRKPLEATAARLVAERDDHEHIAGLLERQLGEMRAAAAADDHVAGFEANVRLTVALHDGCGNSVLVRLLSQVDKAALRYRFRAYRSASPILSEMVKGNTDMIAAIRAGDGARAADVTEALIDRAWRATRALFIANRAR